MLEIKNLVKVYRSKTGDEVRALDNVSISFPESGMVFILGKSGSGKSTLLNIMGGLDSYDSGEFVIKGKSSKDFGGSDFDAYRNTFIGFIFQEYNVLDDFTVGANIALALELQGKKASAEKVNAILSSVDLLNYAKRKPNELSGGQKQRVAIARALVKEPQIIMADEPTGALDSNTGKQIFDTLKELSREKLVLVVSHDRDFAERYADRIIELADGQIISDVTKHEHESEKISEGIDKISGHILKIKGGYRLTADDLEMINRYLAEHSEDVLLSGDGRVNEELRSAAGISDRGTTAVFEGTDAEKDYTLKKYEKKDSKFIRSRLPMKNALRMGSSGLKHKKFRLVMTIFLSLIAFALFGLADTMGAYDKIVATTDSIADSNVKNASVSLGVRHTWTYEGEKPYTSFYDANLNDEDLAYLREKTGLNFVPVYTGGRDSGFYGGMSITGQMHAYEQSNVYTGKIHGLVDMTGEELASAGFTITGRMPEKTGEVAITEVMYRQFKEYGFKNETFKESVAAGQLTMDAGSATSIIGKHITLNSGMHSMEDRGFSFEIVGVIDTQFNYDRYAAYLPKDANSILPQDDENALTDMVLTMELNSEMSYGFHGLGFVKNDDIQTLWNASAMDYQEIGTSMNGWNSSLYIAVNRNDSEEGDKFSDERINRIAGSSALSKLNVTYFDGVTRDKLGENEAIIPSHMLMNLIPEEMMLMVDTAKLDEALITIYGEEAWEQTNPANSYYQRMHEAARYIAWIDHIDEQLAQPEVLDAVREHAAIEGGRPDADQLTVETAKEYWLDWWQDENNYVPPLMGEWLPAFDIYKDSFNFFIEQDVLSVMLPILGMGDYPADNGVADYMDLYRLTEILDNITEENPEYTVYRGDIQQIVMRLYAYVDANESRVWENETFLSFWKEYYDISDDAWNASNEEDRKRGAIEFYVNSYVDSSDCGYEKNPYGRSGKELREAADAVYQILGGFDINEAISQIGFELFEDNYETQNQISKGKLDLKIVGTYDSDTYSMEQMIVCDTLMDTYLAWETESNGEMGYHEDIAEHEDGMWGFALAPLGQNKDVIRMLVEMSYDESGDLRFRMQNYVMDTLDTFNEFIEIFSMVFLYVGIGFAVFSALLLMNFIATSISYKKREIGVLRAVGARSSDVFKIFFSEALIIALVNFLLSTAAVVAAIIFTNNWMHNSGINVTLLSYGPRQFVLMLLISVGVAILASFLPVYNIAKRKPVDAIKNR